MELRCCIGGVLVGVFAVSACTLKTADSSGADELNGDPGAGGAGSGQPNGGAPSGSGSTPGAGLLIIPEPAAGGAASSDAGDECAKATQRGQVITREVEVEVPYEVTETLPKSLYVMLDRSGSMVQDNLCGGWLGALLGCGGGSTQPNKWALAVDGLTRFVTDVGSNNLGVALQYFPGGNCDGSVYDTPAVAMGKLPVIAQNVISSLATIAPSGNTPTAGALRGIARYCTNFNAANPTEQCVGVLVTDGDPTACETDDATLAGILQQAAAGGVQIYIAGMQGATFSRLHALSQAAGTDCTPNDPATFACDMTADRNAFLTSLQAIRAQTVTRTRTEIRTEVQSQVLDCEWKIPPPPEGEVFDSSLVNVKFTGGPAGPVNFGYVADPATCGDIADGWYYDSPTAPTTVKVCPSTCDAIKSVTGAQIDLLLGCATKPAVIN